MKLKKRYSRQSAGAMQAPVESRTNPGLQTQAGILEHIGMHVSSPSLSDKRFFFLPPVERLTVPEL